MFFRINDLLMEVFEWQYAQKKQKPKLESSAHLNLVTSFYNLNACPFKNNVIM